MTDDTASMRRQISHDVSERIARIVAHCQAYQGPQLSRSVRQSALNIALYAVLITAMIVCVKAGFWPAALLIAPFAGLMLVKLFTIQHDCGHQSYFKSRRANHGLGWFISLLTLTPFGFWRDAHNRHHAGSGNLDRRGLGGVDVLTLDEFRRLTPMQRFLYRAYRHPLVLLIIGAPIYFIILQRLPLNKTLPYMETYVSMKQSQIWQSVALLNVGLVFFYGALCLWLGLSTVVLVFVPVVSIAAIVGGWLFYVQHQYENVYWARAPRWAYNDAALLGSSHYELPGPLRRATGDIGLHHIHHLCSRIPNYRLRECYRASEDLQRWPKMKFWESFKTTRLALFDEARAQMISFKTARAAR